MIHPLCIALKVRRPPNCAPPSSSPERLVSGKENEGWERFERFGISVTAFSYKGDYSPISRRASWDRNRETVFPGKNVQRVTMGVAMVMQERALAAVRGGKFQRIFFFLQINKRKILNAVSTVR